MGVTKKMGETMIAKKCENWLRKCENNEKKNVLTFCEKHAKMGRAILRKTCEQITQK